MVYSEDFLDTLCSRQMVVIVELKFGLTLVGYFTHAPYTKNKYKVLPLNIKDDVWRFTRSQIKRIININGYVHPKNPNHKKYKMLDVFELQALLEKAGYTFQ